MSLKVNEVWEDIQIQGGLNDTGEAQTQFLRALKATLEYMDSKLADTFTAPTDIVGVITCETWHHNAVYAGIRFYLQRQGAWSMDSDPESWSFFRQAMSEAIAGNIKDAGSEFETRNQPES